MGSFDEKFIRKIHKTFLYVCLQVSKPKSKKSRQIEWKIFHGCFKNKKEKKHMKRLSFITQFKNQFLLLFTGCRKVLGKMPDLSVFTFQNSF